jgi:hypothetical protein
MIIYPSPVQPFFVEHIELSKWCISHLGMEGRGARSKENCAADLLEIITRLNVVVVIDILGAIFAVQENTRRSSLQLHVGNTAWV